MKNIINPIVAATLALGAVSCNDFLDKTPYDRVDTDININEQTITALTNACYITLQSSNMYNQRIWTLDIVAGNSEVGAGGGTDGLETVQAANFVTQSDNAMALYMWRSPWVGIGHCNDALEAIDKAEGISDKLRDTRRGEALFLRAHYYYVLARLYGGLPSRTSPYVPGQPTAIARESLEDTYKQIIEDCTEAARLLPPKAEYGATEVGRACQDAALTMLADIYLTLAPSNPELYSQVVDLCDQVTSLGYDLSTCSYAANFDASINNGPESIFEVQYSGDTEQDFWGNTPSASWLSTFMGPRNSNLVAGCYGWNQPTAEFVNQYEEGDLRKDITVFYEGCPDFEGTPYKSSWSNTGFNVRKFLVSKTISPEYNTSPANFVVYRYAEVLLMQAEALCELGRPREAAGPLNIVRRRAGLPSISSDIANSKEKMREAIIHERRMELSFEGHRWFDMIRIDGGQYAIDFLKSIGKTNVNKNRLLFPIPQTEIDANPLMTQNPGY